MLLPHGSHLSGLAREQIDADRRHTCCELPVRKGVAVSRELAPRGALRRCVETIPTQQPAELVPGEQCAWTVT